MSIQKYSVNQHPINTLLAWIRAGEIAIPEIQRPFVWSSTKVRDLIDSLYKGYPIGYLIAWRNPSVKLKDGSSSEGKRILIDGQQRVTALMAALLGERVINTKYKRIKIVIAFHPLEQRFEVCNSAIARDKAWIPDIAEVLAPDVKVLKLVSSYCDKNEGSDQDDIYDSIELLRSIVNNHIGLIELNSDLDIETVTQIFIRINSQGVVLSQADFVMSKIAANEVYEGGNLRKCIDYFCHLAIAPDFYHQLADLDQEFAKTVYFQKMSWLANENDDLYDPSYTDMLRVAFTSEFKRGRLEDLVALLSGRNFETKGYEELIAEQSFQTLDRGILNFMNETNFKRFIMVIRSAGFIEASMIRSSNAMNFAYIIYLVLKTKNYGASSNESLSHSDIESIVRKWFVLSVLTGRYSRGAPETAFDSDINRVNEFGARTHLSNLEAAELSDAFWDSGLPQQMNTSVASSPYFNVYLASQVHANDKGFLSKDITVRDLISHKGDLHHVFPKDYLKKNGFSRVKYNQIANYVMTQSEINIAIRAKPPALYFSELLAQCQNQKPTYGAITNLEELKTNFVMHCIPDNMENQSIETYDEFLSNRRELMSLKIRDFYQRL